jgi:hypothetical protein
MKRLIVFAVVALAFAVPASLSARPTSGSSGAYVLVSGTYHGASFYLDAWIDSRAYTHGTNGFRGSDHLLPYCLQFHGNQAAVDLWSKSAGWTFPVVLYDNRRTGDPDNINFEPFGWQQLSRPSQSPKGCLAFDGSVPYDDDFQGSVVVHGG